MYVTVRLLSGFTKPLTYKVPQGWDTASLAGAIVHVPLRNKLVPAIITNLQEEVVATYAIRELKTREQFPADPNYPSFIEKISQFYFLDPMHFYGRIKNFLRPNKRTMQIVEESLEQAPAAKQVTLTDAQQRIVDALTPAIHTPTYTPALIHGVTGSGKTEVYKKLIVANFQTGKTSMLLHPEVTLSMQFFRILRAGLPAEIPIYSFHSATKESEKKALWRCLIAKKPCLILGVHLPVLLPVANLGLIVIDEEHETGFLEKKHPKINSKEIAIWRANLAGIPIVLGSATPSLTSLCNVKERGWQFFVLTERFGGSFPTVRHVLLDNKIRRKNFWVSRELEGAIGERLARKEQVIIFLNRRGLSFFVTCKQCRFTFTCDKCSVSLTPHESDGGEELQCHYCGHAQKMPDCCPACKASEKYLLRKGIGTQQAVRVLQAMFPAATIARADLDSTKKKREWDETVKAMTNGQVDILVGTQTITKGYHFPRVTLVGVLWADSNLHFPMYNASESCLQQLVQVAGRAGRGSLPGEVIIQSLSDHPIFKFLSEQDYLQFYESEMGFRKDASYPPYAKFVQIELKGSDAEVLDSETDAVFAQLIKINEEKQLGIILLGPVKPIVYKVQTLESRQIFCKSASFAKVHHLLTALDTAQLQSSVHIVPSS